MLKCSLAGSFYKLAKNVEHPPGLDLCWSLENLPLVAVDSLDHVYSVDTNRLIQLTSRNRG